MKLRLLNAAVLSSFFLVPAALVGTARAARSPHQPRIGARVLYVLREGVVRPARVVERNIFHPELGQAIEQNSVNLVVDLDGPNDGVVDGAAPTVWKGYVLYDADGAVGTWHRDRDER